MRARDLREKTDAELGHSLADLRRDLFDIGMRASTGQVEKAGRARQVRKDIARIMTMMNQRKKDSYSSPRSRSGVPDGAGLQTGGDR